MNWKNTLLSISVILAVAFTAKAQDIHFTQFNLSPLTLNPSLTGAHNGLWRANAIYRSQWAGVTTAYNTIGAGVDGPVFRNIGQDNYLALGMNLFSDRSGDGNLLNNTAMASAAYHILLKNAKYDGARFNPGAAFSFGMQFGYAQKSINLSRLYFSDEFRNGGYNPGTTQEFLKPKTSNFIANAGVNFSSRLAKAFGFQLGGAVYNINQPLESFQARAFNKEIGLAPRITGQFGADIYVGAESKFVIRPAAIYMTQAKASELLVGSELSYALNNDVPSKSAKVFVGGWTRVNDAMCFTAGLEKNGFRFGGAYDVTTSSFKTAGANVSAFEIGVSYTRPDPLDDAKKVYFPCSRF